MKMGNIASPWRYDEAARHPLQQAILRRPAIFVLRLFSRRRPIDGLICDGLL
jgi:hypothetical protein